MKKILLLITTFFIGTSTIYAADSISASISTSSSRATLTINSNGTIGQIYGTFSCGKLGSKNLQYVNSEGSTSKSKTYTINFSNASAGSYTCSVSGLQVGTLTDPGSGVRSIQCSSKSFTIGNTSSSSSSKSSSKSTSSISNAKTTNNETKEEEQSNTATLKSLTVEGQELSPKFNANTTEYNLTVPYDVKTIKINANAADSKSKVTGTGEKSLKEGANKFEIKVTAENGDVKTYTLNVTVDTKPITVKVNGKKYTLIKNKEELPELDIEHEDMMLTLEEQEIPAYRIDKINYVLVGLKDSKGKIDLYQFKAYKDNEKPDEYKLFKRINSAPISIVYLDFPKKLVPDKYKKYTEEINGDKITIYKLAKDSRFGLVYGLNLETGKKNIYKYDTKEGTVQLYEKIGDNGYKHQLEVAKIIIASLIAFSGLLLILIVIILATRRRKIKKVLNKYKEKMGTLN